MQTPDQQSQPVSPTENTAIPQGGIKSISDYIRERTQEISVTEAGGGTVADAEKRAVTFLGSTLMEAESNPDALFGHIFARRQDMIGKYAMDVATIVSLHLPEDHRAHLLSAIAEYDATGKIKDQPDVQKEKYKKIYEGLLALNLLDNPLMEFLRWNYAFLAGRNAKVYLEAPLDDVYAKAMTFAKRIEGESGYEQLGYVTYNISRHLLDNVKDQAAAKKLYVESARHRLDWYRALVAGRTASEETLLSAAQQVAKMYIDWETYFGADTIEDCPVNYTTMVDMMSRFGAKEISAFSATKKQFKP